MSSNRSKDRLSLCSFTFADGRRCRTPRQSGHPFLCCFHAQREAQAQAAEEIGRDVSYFLSGDFLSACDLSLALGRVFAAAARGQLKPKTAGTLAYLGQTLLQTIQLAQHEYINAFDTDGWRNVIYTHVKENGKYLAAPPVPAPAPAPALTQTAEQLPPQPTQSELGAVVEAGLQPGVSNHGDVPAARGSSPTLSDPAPPLATVSSPAQSAGLPAVAGSSSAPSRLPRSAAEFAATILASASSSAPPVAQTAPPCSPATSAPHIAAPPGNTRHRGVANSPSAPTAATSAPRSPAPSNSSPSQTPKPAAAPPPDNSSSASSQSSPRPIQASELPGFGKPANWEVLIPEKRSPVRRPRSACRRRQIRPGYLPE